MADKESRAHSAMAGEKKSSHKKSDGKKSAHKHVHVMHIRHAANGGHIATHEFEPPEDGMGAAPPSEDHIIPPGGDNLANHVTDNMQPPEPEPAPAAGGGAAPGGAPAPMPGM